MRARHEPEPPWAAFADALSGMLFVFILTTFWFAWQQATTSAEAAAMQARYEQKVSAISGARDKAKELTDDAKGQVTTCLRGAEGQGRRLDVYADSDEARLSLFVPGVEWFVLDSSTFQEEALAWAGIDRIRACIELLLDPAVLDREQYTARVHVEGHTDGLQATGNEVRNWALSGERAATVLYRILSESSAIQAAQDEGRIQLLAVGVADRHPAMRRICAEVGTANASGVDRADAQVCEQGRDPQSLLAAMRDAIASQPSLFALNEQCRPRPGAPAPEPISPGSISDATVLQTWANRCVSTRDRNEARLAMLRRVDLRLELLVPEKVDVRPAQ